MSPLAEVRKCSVAGSAAVGLLCGQFLGEGMSRKVFVCGLDSSLVVKVETEAGRFQNVKEWELWQEIQYTSAAKWLAPCLHLSPDGTILVMARTSPLALAITRTSCPCGYRIASSPTSAGTKGTLFATTTGATLL